MPKVSVITPVYGVEKYIERCARSLFEQTLDDIEYLFIDDCTPDRSIEILKRVMEEYPQRKSQVTIHRKKQNGGQAKAREWAINKSTGDYIIHCDSDDWVDVDYYKALYDKAVETGADIVVSDFKLYDGSHEEIHKGILKNEMFLSDMMYSKVTWSLWNKLISRSVYSKGFVAPQANVGEDMAIVLQLSKRVEKIEYVPDVYYYYFYNQDSTMNVSSEEKIYNKYQQMCSNVDIVCEAYKDVVLPFNVDKRLSAIKLYCQVLLVPILQEKYQKEWKRRNSFPSLRTIIDPNVRVRYKVVYCAGKLGIYNFLKRINNSYSNDI